jgi:UDP-N-acetylglucosamine:LPS N-acetylglucosamine transferase
MRRVLIAGGGTGGHLMPALAIAQTLTELAPDVEPVLVGAVRGVEARLLPTRDFRFHLLPSEPIYRRTGGRMSAGRSSPATCCARWAKSSRRSSRWQSSARAATRPLR